MTGSRGAGSGTAGAGAWTTGAGLGVFAAAGLVDLDWDVHQRVLVVAALVAGVGLVLTLHGLARRAGLRGAGPALLGLGLACGLVEVLVEVDDSLTVVALALVTVGTPALVWTIAGRTTLLGAAGVFAAVGVSGIGTSVTAVVVRRTVSASDWLDVTLDVAVLLGVLVAAASAGMVLAGRLPPGHLPPGHLPPGHLPAGRPPRVLPPAPPGPGAAEPPVAVAADAPQREDRLTLDQRLTLIVGFAGTIAAAVISVIGALITAS
ncbi:hypothetical protein [Umezawaea beigongshangensis]|uniref:hypothetical protein n=1 Tax=Umezawaea beigongshangensis TaxID=2780383 RepID=UPI0018F1EC23|nr:hypothetical protein [Umezawaea beigongshangensis]